VCVHYWSTLIGKISVVFSIWMFIIIAMLFISKIIISNKRESFKTGKTDSLLKEASDNAAPDQYQM
jgi:Na+-transporting methylmalonyl-CoA/oxaloacetate decarboxylase gamma subunit